MNYIKEKIASFLLKNKKSGFVYFGHGVAEGKSDNFIEHLHIQKDELIELIKFWKRMNVSFLSLNELVQLSKNNFKTNHPWVHFTFDDGYENNLTTLVPIIEEYNIPVTIFVSTGFIQNEDRMPGYYIRTAIMHTKRLHSFKEKYPDLFIDEKSFNREKIAKEVSFYYKKLDNKCGDSFLNEVKELLSIEEWCKFNKLYQNDQFLTLNQLEEMARHPLITIGTHGLKHYILHKDQPEELVNEELKIPYSFIQTKLNITPISHAYPNGGINDYTNFSQEIIESKGYKLCFTTTSGFVGKNTRQLEIPRITLTPKAGWIVKEWIKSR